MSLCPVHQDRRQAPVRGRQPRLPAPKPPRHHQPAVRRLDRRDRLGPPWRRLAGRDSLTPLQRGAYHCPGHRAFRPPPAALLDRRLQAGRRGSSGVPRPVASRPLGRLGAGTHTATHGNRRKCHTFRPTIGHRRHSPHRVLRQPDGLSHLHTPSARAAGLLGRQDATVGTQCSELILAWDALRASMQFSRMLARQGATTSPAVGTAGPG